MAFQARPIPPPSQASAAASPYPPNGMQGARDISTPYGLARVYEWGSEDPSARKIVLVHGDGTPCLLFSKIARGLVEKGGCRVLLFDLYGRGYSSAPLHVRHDARLFATQILAAIASSPVSWTGNGNTFTLVGFSLGAPIAMYFAATFPAMVDGVVLLAPGGLLREMPESYVRLGEYIEDNNHSETEVAKDGKLGVLVAACLGVDAHSKGQDEGEAPDGEQATERVQAPGERELNMQQILQWQYDNHSGFVNAFVSSVRHGPYQNQQDIWRVVCDVIAGRGERREKEDPVLQSAQAEAAKNSKLQDTKLLIFFGEKDAAVKGNEVIEDIVERYELLPREKLEVRWCEGGHGFVYPESGKILEEILRFWGDGEGLG